MTGAGGAPYTRGMSIRTFHVVLEAEAEGGFSIYVPSLPGCASQGETQEEALVNIREAIEGYLLGLKDDGLPFPSDRAILTKVHVTA